MDKKLLRDELKKARSMVPAAERQKRDALILEGLQDWKLYRNKERVFIYLSIGWEIDTWPIVDDLVARGSQVYAPVVQNKPRALLPRLYTSRSQLKPAVFGILEPPKDAPGIEPNELDLIIVPALAFSLGGYRIGYGGGFYDRFLASSQALSVGLGYSGFLQDLPVDPWDKPVDFIATEQGVMGRK